jgi:hypothetical protein
MSETSEAIKDWKKKGKRERRKEALVDATYHLIIMPWLLFYGVKTVFIPMPTNFRNFIAFLALYLVIRSFRLGK